MNTYVASAQRASSTLEVAEWAADSGMALGAIADRQQERAKTTDNGNHSKKLRWPQASERAEPKKIGKLMINGLRELTTRDAMAIESQVSNNQVLIRKQHQNSINIDQQSSTMQKSQTMK